MLDPWTLDPPSIWITLALDPRGFLHLAWDEGKSFEACDAFPLSLRIVRHVLRVLLHTVVGVRMHPQPATHLRDFV